MEDILVYFTGTERQLNTLFKSVNNIDKIFALQVDSKSSIHFNIL